MATSADRDGPRSPVDLTGETRGPSRGRITDSSNLARLRRRRGARRCPAAHVIYKPVRGRAAALGLPRRHARRARGRRATWSPSRRLGRRAADRPARRPARPGVGAAVDRRPVRARRPTTSSSTSCREGRTPRAGCRSSTARRRAAGRHRRARGRRRRALAVAVLDAVLNNADRKGSHCLRDRGRRALGLRPRRDLLADAEAAHRAVGLGGRAAARTPTSSGWTACRRALDGRRRRARAPARLLPAADVERSRLRVARAARRAVHPIPAATGRPCPGRRSEVGPRTRARDEGAATAVGSRA